MPHADKRDSYRVEDYILVTYQVIRPTELQRTRPEDHFDLPPAFSLLRELYRLNLDVADSLRHITATDRVLGHLLANMNQRMQLLAQAVITTTVGQNEPQARANISQGGLSFMTAELLGIGAHVALKLQFRPTQLELVCFGQVRHCRLRADSELYTAGIRFLQLDGLTQDLISRHVIRTQAEERRARLRQDGHLIEE
jgi:hypothetical protein